LGLGSSICICTSIHNWNLRLVLHRCKLLLISLIYSLFSCIMIMIPPPPPPLPAYPASPFPFPLAQILQFALFDNLKVRDIILFKNLYFANNKGQTLTMVHRIAQIRTNPQGERTVRTKGDHTPASIPKLDYPISEVLYRQTHVCYSESGLNCQTVFSAGKLHFC